MGRGSFNNRPSYSRNTQTAVHPFTCLFLQCVVRFYLSPQSVTSSFPWSCLTTPNWILFSSFSWFSVDTSSCHIPLPSLLSPKLVHTASVRNDLPIFRSIQTRLVFTAQIKCCSLRWCSPLSPTRSSPSSLANSHAFHFGNQSQGALRSAGLRDAWTVWQTNHPLLGPRDWLWNFWPWQDSEDNCRHIAGSQCTIVFNKWIEST